jgi:hypothetical protein
MAYFPASSCSAITTRPWKNPQFVQMRWGWMTSLQFWQYWFSVGFTAW